MTVSTGYLPVVRVSVCLHMTLIQAACFLAFSKGCTQDEEVESVSRDTPRYRDSGRVEVRKVINATNGMSYVTVSRRRV